MPGGIESIDRFARASYFLHYLPEPRDAAEAVAGVVSIAGTVSCPPGAPYEDFGVYPTWWVSAIDLTHLTYYFWSRTSPALIWAELPRLNLRPGAPVRAVDPGDPGLAGDVSGCMLPAELSYSAGTGRRVSGYWPAPGRPAGPGTSPPPGGMPIGAAVPGDGTPRAQAEERLAGRFGQAIQAPIMSSATTNTQ